MAGESPDRSKQRESSAEPTSGSGGTVPDPASAPSAETPTERRDPRLAMSRETPAPRVAVDTATKVLSRADLEAARRKDGAPATGAAGAEDAGAGNAGADTPEAEGPGAREADAEDAGGTAAEVESAAAGDAEVTDAGEVAADGGDTVGEPVARAEAADAGDAAGGEAADAEAGSTADGDADATEAEETREARGRDSEDRDDRPAGAGDDRLRAAVAAWVASADADDAVGAEAGDARDAAADPEKAEGDDSTAGERQVAASGTTPGAGSPDPAASEADRPTAASDTDKSHGPAAAGTGEPAAASDTDETSTAAEPADAVEDDAATSAPVRDAEPTDSPVPADREDPRRGASVRDAEPADATPAHAEPADAAPAHAEPADAAPTGAEPADAAGAVDREDPRRGASVRDAEASGGEGAGQRASTADAEAADRPADGEGPRDGRPASGDESRGGKRGVDQPTAVFKAVRPTPEKPPVDQPTTMLKAPRPEAPSERTSKFVALKPDMPSAEPRTDAPKSPAPKSPAPDVTAAVPQVGPERTTQQPLPPKPPLDLLAELTNTPPPPETPVRTLVRRIKIWTPLVLLLVIVFAIAQAVRPLPTPTLALTAEESYAFDGDKVSLPWPGEGQGWMDVNGIGTMSHFGKQTPVAIGSVAKAMTAYIVLRDHPMKPGEDGKKIKVDALAEKEGGYDKDGESTLNTVKEGDTLTQHDAIAAIMIPSANNIARLLARWDAGSEKAFIQKMNDTAKELGMKNTTYTDASGLKETTVSTAEDQVKLGNEIVKIPALTEITRMGQWIDPSGKKWYNYNYLVPYNGAIGIKTGTTTAAGGNLLFAARKEIDGETVTLVGAVLGQHKAPIIQTVNDVSKTAMFAAQDELTSAKILKKGDVVGYVDDGLGGRTPVVLTQDVTAVGWSGYRVKLSFDADDVPHTAKAGTKVGTLTVGDGTSGAVKAPVALQSDLTEPGFTAKVTRLG
ncbi:D-alanyl-D-alanine carboxypeptidase [Streptomyces sp. NPDC007808]|uniref:D-alanyl-D-alanine carboxypeptidase n=1 Tax=Streptomyces sp. NPDC007808 TaxID=3364779 RepID=UPI0036ADCC62